MWLIDCPNGMDSLECWYSCYSLGRMGGRNPGPHLLSSKAAKKLIFILLVGFGEGRLAAVTSLREDSQYFASMNVRNSRKPWINSFRAEKGADPRKTDPKPSFP